MSGVADILSRHRIDAPSAPGRHYATCPQCSNTRSREHQRLRCLGITINGDGVTWGCNHCGWKGGAGYNGSSRYDPFVATYDYADESGQLLFQVCRKPDKQFRQRRPDGRGGWTWGTKDVRRVLYR